MIDPGTIVFAISALIKLARAGDKAAAQYARDRSVVLPLVEVLEADEAGVIEEHIGISLKEQERLKKDESLAQAWAQYETTRRDSPPEVIAILHAEALRIRGPVNGSAAVTALSPDEIGAALKIKQWRDGTGPQPAWIGLALSVVNVALEYVALDPSITSLKAGPARFVGAVAGNLADLVADNDPWDKRAFAERVVEIVVHAGLKALHDQPDALIADQSHRALVANTLKPVLDAWPKTISEQKDYQKLVDALLGPAFKAAVTTLAERPGAFFGQGLGAEKLPGLLVKAMLDELKQRNSLRETFTEENALALFRAGTKALAAHPELALGTNKAPADQFARQFFKEMLDRVAALAQTPDALFTRDFGIALAVAAIESVEASTGRILHADNPWQALAGTVFEAVARGLKDALGAQDPKLLGKMVSEDFLLDLARIFLNQAAKTPHMIAPKRQELQTLVAAIATAIAADKDLRLSRADWLAVAGVAAQEAAANPGRLFGIKREGAGWLAGAILVDVLKAAAGHFDRAAKAHDEASAADPGRAQAAPAGAILFGPTLRDVLAVTIRSASGNFAALLKDSKLLEQLIGQLMKLVDEQPARFGSNEFLALYTATIDKTLREGKLPELDLAVLDRLSTSRGG